MEISLTHATGAIQQFLQTLEEINEAVIRECHELLLDVWHVENSAIRQQIIETAAINAGLMSE